MTTATRIYRSGFCTSDEPGWSHRHCRGEFRGVPCGCICHRPPTTCPTCGQPTEGLTDAAA